MIYNCRICGNDADWDEGHGCALGTPENERHRLTLKERNVARAELERLKGELAEAKRALTEIQNCTNECYLCDDHRDAPQLGGAPPPAESTPVLCEQHGREDCPRPDHPKGAKP